MKHLPLIVLLTILSVHAALAQPSDDRWMIYGADGEAASIDEIVDRAADADVIFVGEQHDDSLGHRFKRELLERLDRGAQRPLALSLEMFEQDVQLVIDEFIAGFITEQHFLASSRPWPNYEEAYRPLVEYARERSLPIVAANPPRRYVNAVSRRGPAVLDSLFYASHRFLPPLPLPAPSTAYRDAFMEAMSGMHGHGAPSVENLFEAQRLWDAGMAHAIRERLDRAPGTLVMHVAGGFHVERSGGIPASLRVYKPDAAMVVVAVRPAAAFDPAEHASLDDFIVLTTHP